MALLLLQHFGEFVLRADLIRPCRTVVRWGTFPKGEGFGVYFSRIFAKTL